VTAFCQLYLNVSFYKWIINKWSFLWFVERTHTQTQTRKHSIRRKLNMRETVLRTRTFFILLFYRSNQSKGHFVKNKNRGIVSIADWTALSWRIVISTSFGVVIMTVFAAHRRPVCDPVLSRHCVACKPGIFQENFLQKISGVTVEWNEAYETAIRGIVTRRLLRLSSRYVTSPGWRRSCLWSLIPIRFKGISDFILGLRLGTSTLRWLRLTSRCHRLQQVVVQEHLAGGCMSR